MHSMIYDPLTIPGSSTGTSSSSSSEAFAATAAANPNAAKFDLFDDFIRAFMTMFQILTNEGTTTNFDYENDDINDSDNDNDT